MSFSMKDLKTAIAVIICVGMMAAVLVPMPSFAGETSKAAVTAEAVQKRIPILMYHNFTKNMPGKGLSATISEEKFEDDMTWLSRNGYTPLLPQDVVAIMDGEAQMPENPVIITIDDGYESAYNIAFPVLKETGMKATVYLIVKGADEPTKMEIKKLNWDQMKEMYESGYMDIQSHSYALHQETYSYAGKIGMRKGLIECESMYYARIQPDIEKSIRLIEENVGNDVVSFSYPFGVFEEWGEAILAEEGVRYAVTTRYGLADMKSNVFELRRFSIGQDTDLSLLLKPEDLNAIYAKL